MKPTRCAAWFAPGGNASYFPALLFARVGAEDPRYPRPLPWLLPLREPGAFFRPHRDQSAPWLFRARPGGSIVGWAKRSVPTKGHGLVGTARKSAPLPTLLQVLSYFSAKSRANALMAPSTSRSARWRGLSWRKTTANLR